jgi:DNA primase
VCEGEKDADRVASLGHCATTVASGKWSAADVSALAGRDIFILEDDDEAGRQKAIAAANALHSVADTIRIIRMPDGANDVSDWLDADPSRADRLVDICVDAPLWEPSGVAPKPEPCVLSIPAGVGASARAAVAAAQEDYDAAVAAQSRLWARQRELDDAVISARNELASSVDGVLIAEAAARAFEEAKAALAHLVGARCVLRAVCAKSRLEGDWRQTSRAEAVRKQAWADAGLGDDGADVWKHLDWSLGGLAERDESADAAPWRAVREALFTDPDAPLPEAAGAQGRLAGRTRRGPRMATGQEGQDQGGAP